MAHEHRLTELDSGVRIVTEAMPSVRSVSLGYWIGTGSRAETDEQAGLSHLLEHLLFKGTARYRSHEIDEIFDAMGAEINAGTGKETTSLYSRVIDDHVEQAFDVMSDMIWAPRLDDVDSEREVILEEIAMYEDDPQDKIFDVLGEAVFGSHPLGRAIIGRAEVVAETPPEAIAAFHHARYVPRNIVIAAAGSIDHDALVALARTRVPGAGLPLAGPDEPPLELAPRVRFERKDTEQYHVALGAPGLARDDERRFALRVLDTIFGGTSSSRLFQEVREKRGLAYSIYSFSGQYAGIGQVGVYVGTRADNLSAALEVVAGELERLRREAPSKAELARAKDNLRGRMVLALESTGARMNRLGSSVLTGVPLLTVDEAVAAVEAVTLEDVTELAAQLFDPARLSAAGIGPEESTFRSAVAPVGGVLA
ncbi:MAG: peptidase domain protein [Solirubrobacterales bacterium]|nr:peptidase domain protein [Solirubrobacterales bacterium]